MNKDILFNMNKVDDGSIEKFFDSYFNERDYFHLKNNDLIFFDDYLNCLKNKKYEFDNVVEDIVLSVRNKHNDVVTIEPYFNSDNSLAIIENNRTLIASRRNNWESINNDDILINDIEKELSEILDISDKFDYTKEREGFLSVSRYFAVNPMYFSLVHVLLQDTTLLAKLKLVDNDYLVDFFNEKYLKRHTKNNVKRLYLSK